MVSLPVDVRIVDSAAHAPTTEHTYAVRPSRTAYVVSAVGASHDDGVDEGLGVEGSEVVRTLAEADELDRHAELALDGDDDAALGRAVELGQHDPRDVDGLREDLRLLEAVLAGGGVEDEEHLVDLALLLDDALDLAELVHQADLVVQAAGGVDDDDVDLLLDARLDGVKRHGSRVGAVLVGAHGGDADPGTPRLELVGGGGTEGVGGTEEHLAVLGHEDAGELPDGRRLAGAVDPDDEDDRGALTDAAARDPTVHVRLDEREQVFPQPGADGGLVGRAVDLDPGAERVDELGGGLDPEVGGDEGVLDLLPGLLVEPAAREQGQQALSDGGVRARETRAQPGEPPAGGLGALDRRLGNGRDGGGGRRRRLDLDGGLATGPLGRQDPVGRVARRLAVEVVGGQARVCRGRLPFSPPASTAQQAQAVAEGSEDDDGADDDEDQDCFHDSHPTTAPAAVPSATD